MTLEQHIRNKTAKFIRPLLLNTECEICKVEDSLELHHIKPFAELLSECLNNLKLDKITNIEDYNELELENITNYMLGVQLQAQYLTLCGKCHKETHEEIGALCEIGNNFRLHCENKRKAKELVEKQRIKTVLIPYLESLIDKKLYKNDQQVLIDVFESIELKTRTMGVNSLNGILKDKDVLYKITSNKDNRRKLEDGSVNSNRGKMFWEIAKYENI